MKQTLSIVAVFVGLASLALGAQQQDERLRKLEESLKSDVPRVVCLNEKFTTGGQPSEQAWSRLAASGFRSVLNMRTANEGFDVEREKSLVEGSGMRYISVPVVTADPRAEQVAEFVRAVKEADNHPMMIHCGSGNRVGAFWLIYRVMEDGWSESAAIEEAERVGLRSPELKRFALDYISAHSPKK